MAQAAIVTRSGRCYDYANMLECAKRSSWVVVALVASLSGCKGPSETRAPADAETRVVGDDRGAPKGPSEQEILAASDLPPEIEAPLSEDPMQVSVHRLSNGMTVYISTDRQKPRFAAWVGVRAGSRMDPPDSTGLAHYLEHMLFKGTDDFGTLDAKAEAPHVQRVQDLYRQLRQTEDPARREAIQAEIDEHTQAMGKHAVPNELDRMYASMGVENLNAFTSDEQTVYVAEVPSNRLDAWARVEAERFADPVFRLFYPELEAVYEEKNLSLDNPWSRVWETTSRALFPRHPYGTQTTIGEVEHLKNPAYDDMVEFFEQWYAPNNMAIALAGDIDPATALPVLEETFGRLRPRPLPEPHAGEIAPLQERKVEEVLGEGQQSVRLAWLTVPVAHEDEPALVVMDRLLDDDKVGLLNLHLELTGKVPSVSSWHSTYNESGYFGVSAGARDDQDLQDVEDMLVGALDRLKAGEFTDADIEAVKTQLDVAEKRELEEPWARASKMMTSYIEHQPWDRVVARDRALREVSREDVLRVANTYLSDAYVVVRKKHGKPEIPKLEKPEITPVPIDPSRSSAFAQRVLSIDAESLAPEWVTEGEHYVRSRLPAGEMIAVRNERNDLFSVTYRFDRGYRKEPLLCFALDVLELSGTPEASAEAFQKQLYALGSSVSTSCNSEYSSISIEGLDANLEPTLELVNAWLGDPVFDETIRKRVYQNTLTRRRDVMEQDRTLTSALENYAMYGKASAWLKHPDNESLRRAERNDIHRVLTRMIGYQHRTLYFGPRSAQQAAKVVAMKGKRFKPAGEVWTRSYRRVPETMVFFLHKEKAKANVRLAIPRGPLGTSDRPLAGLLSEYLSGNMSALVFQEIRESRGLAYSAYSTYSTGTRPKDESALLGFMSTQADKTPMAVETMLRLMKSREIQPERLLSARSSLDQEYRSSRINPRWIHWWIMEWDERGEKGDPRPREWKAVLDADVEAIERFSQDFGQTPMIMAILGDRARVGLEELRQHGRVVELQPEDLFSYGAFPPVEGEKDVEAAAAP